MQKPAAYRRHAEECRKLAGTAASDSAREQLLDMADTWVNLAAAREEMLARYPELDTSQTSAPVDEACDAACSGDLRVKDEQEDNRA